MVKKFPDSFQTVSMILTEVQRNKDFADSPELLEQLKNCKHDWYKRYLNSSRTKNYVLHERIK